MPPFACSIATLALSLLLLLLLPPSSVQSSPAPLPSPSLLGRRAVVTGGTKGIGRGVVRELLSCGCAVLTCSRTAADLAELERDMQEEFPGCDLGTVPADVATPAGRAALLAAASELSPQLDVLVNNVGTNIRKPTLGYEPAEVRALLDANLLSCLHLSQALHPLLKAAGRSSIVNVGSVAGVTCIKTGAVYAMTKAAMNQLTGTLCCEWAKDGVRVNCVCPWYINTPLARQVLKNRKYKKRVLDRTPMGRVGEVEEVAALVGFLAGDRASYISGQVISVDGGFTRNGALYDQ